jgi:hypothetical protein
MRRRIEPPNGHVQASDLAGFEAAVRDARAVGFEWRSAYAALARALPSADVPAINLFSALTADIEDCVAAGKVSAYHNHLHTLDTMRAMSLLCNVAARMGLRLQATPHILLLAMLGHDLRHPGGSSNETRDIERASADLVAAMARDCLMPSFQIAQIVDLILSTRPRLQVDIRAGGSGDLLHYLVGEADVMASLLPGVGLDLAVDLTREMEQAGERLLLPFEEPQARLAFLNSYGGLSAPAKALGLEDAVKAQISALRLNDSRATL